MLASITSQLKRTALMFTSDAVRRLSSIDRCTLSSAAAIRLASVDRYKETSSTFKETYYAHFILGFLLT